MCGSAPDGTLIDATAALVMDQQAILSLPQVDALALRQRMKTSEIMASTLEKEGKAKVRQHLAALSLAVIVHPDRIDASISRRLLIAQLDGEAPDAADDGFRIAIAIPTRPERRGHNLRLVVGSRDQRQARIDPELVALLRKAEAARQKLFTGNDPSQSSDRAAERIARLAFLAPDIVAAILDGQQPKSLTPRRLMKQAAIPLNWKSQRKALGF